MVDITLMIEGQEDLNWDRWFAIGTDDATVRRRIEAHRVTFGDLLPRM